MEYLAMNHIRQKPGPVPCFLVCILVICFFLVASFADKVLGDDFDAKTGYKVLSDGVRKGKVITLGTKADRNSNAIILYTKASKLMDQKLEASEVNVYNDLLSNVGWYNPETYQLLINVIENYPETESAIRSQLRLAYILQQTKFTNEDYLWSFELFNQIEINYSERWEGMMAGYLKRVYSLYPNSSDEDAIRRSNLKIKIDDLANYEDKFKLFVNIDKDIDLLELERVFDGTVDEQLSDYYGDLSYWYHFVCDYKKAEEYVNKSIRLNADNDLATYILKMLTDKRKCYFDKFELGE